jgi:hypothetical protein
MTFTQYLEFIGYANPAGDLHGMDDGARFARLEAGPDLISVPTQSVQGQYGRVEKMGSGLGRRSGEVFRS